MLPGGERTRIAAIDTYDGELEEAIAPMSVTLRLEDELDVSRGELICHPDEAPAVARELEADVCWMAESRCAPAGATSSSTPPAARRRSSTGSRTCVDVHTLERDAPPAELALNDIGRVRLRTERAARVRPLHAATAAPAASS